MNLTKTVLDTMLISDTNYPHRDIVNKTHLFILGLFGDTMRLDDY